jgi:hypothetical protein
VGALSLLEEALASIRTISDAKSSPILGALGDIARLQGSLDLARSRYRDALILARGDSEVYQAHHIGRIGSLLVDEGRFEPAARLLGVQAAWLARYPQNTYDDAPEQDLAPLQAALGEDAFTVAWAAGQAMSLEQAVEYALREVGETQ